MSDAIDPANIRYSLQVQVAKSALNLLIQVFVSTCETWSGQAHRGMDVVASNDDG